LSTLLRHKSTFRLALANLFKTIHVIRKSVLPDVSVATLLGLVLLVGCSSGARHEWSAGSFSTTRDVENGTVQYNVECLRCDGRLYFVVCDNGQPIAEGVAAGPRVEQRLQTSDGRDIRWSCATLDGTTGTVLFDGRTFALEGGAVFLASSEGGATRVEQLMLDMAKLQESFEERGIDQTLCDLGQREAVVAHFLASCTSSGRQ
jgi:hypothetical protein